MSLSIFFDFFLFKIRSRLQPEQKRLKQESNGQLDSKSSASEVKDDVSKGWLREKFNFSE